MATKSRNINYFLKGIALLLSAALIGAVCLFGIHFVQCAVYFRSGDSVFESVLKDNKTYADFQPLPDKIVDDMFYLYEKSGNSEFELEALQAQLDAERDLYITQGLKVFNEQRSQFGIIETTTSSDDAESDGEYEDHASYVDGQFSYVYTINADGEAYTLDIDDYAYINLNDDVDKVEEKLGMAYDNFVSNEILDSYNYPGYIVSDDLKYYVYNRESDEVLTNLSTEELAAFKAAPETVSVKAENGVVSCSEDFTGVLEGYTESATDELVIEPAQKCDFLFYINPAGGSYGSNSYGAMLSNFSRLASYNMKRETVGALVLLALALALTFLSCTVAGRRLENGKVKRMWLDYIPTDLHFILSGGLITGAVLLLAYIADDLYYLSGYDDVVSHTAGMVFLAAAAWLVMLEYLTSLVRVCRSERGLWNNLFVVMLLKYLIVKPVAAICRALKTAATYHPNNFKKQLKNYGILYIVFNSILLLLFLFCIAADVVFLPEFLGILLIAVNTAALVFIISYIIKLDKIITAANLRTVPQVDYLKLPVSLKILYDSLQYTRQELDTAVSKAVKDERMRTELITNVSHDLKTPLTSIITYVDLLKQCDVQDENAREYIAVLDDKGRRLKRLIDDLIEASKITSGVITLHPVMLNLNELAAQAVFERQHEFIESGLELVFKGDKTSVSCYADGDKTFRIMDNLISNARKYSARGTRVYCDVYETQNFSVFEIKNTSAEQLDITPQELTERFVRGDRSRNADGNGLGLSIADNLCKAQHGKLNITIDGDLFKAQVMLPKHN